MTEKLCTKCDEWKPLSEFSPKKDAKGRYPSCKSCANAITRTWRLKNRAKWVIHARTYARKLYKRFAAQRIVQIAEWREAFPDRYKAQNKVLKAIKRGVLKRPKSCSICGATKYRIEAHHEDYAKPLDIVWLCKPCHMEADALRREKEAA